MKLSILLLISLNINNKTIKYTTLSMKSSTISLTRHKESSYLNNSYKYLIGVDEAGRGPLAGPVVAASCLIPYNEELINGITDSKLINEVNREKLYDIITNNENIYWSVAIISNNEIDDINILQASLKAMRLSTISLLNKTNKSIPLNEIIALVDGNKIPQQMPVDTQAIIKGDSNIYSIAAASIIAKVTRDRIMLELDKQYPNYNLKQHKGYPTREHERLLYKYGPSPIHRYSYRPVALAAQKHSDKNNSTNDERLIEEPTNQSQTKRLKNTNKTDKDTDKIIESNTIANDTTLRRSNRLKNKNK